MQAYRQIVIGELDRTLSAVDEGQYQAFVAALTQPGRRVLCVGVGRVLISMKAWVKRLVHLDIDINYVGSESERPIGPGDLLIAASASGESIFPVAIAKKAKELGAQVAYLGCTPGSAVDRLADLRLILQGRTKFTGKDQPVSVQPMSTLFEQQLYLLCDIITLDLMQRNGWEESYVKGRHANLE